MNFNVKIISGNRSETCEAKQGSSLLTLIRLHQLEHYAPCGGNGTCGKCKVIVEGTGTVNSCQYFIEKDVTVHLPDRRMMDVLTTQYIHTVSVPFMPGYASVISSYPMGLAIDIGTTTIVSYLMNLITGVQIGVRSEVNPQARYGADVISRINYCITHAGGLHELRDLTIHRINEQINRFAGELQIGTEFFTKIVVAGNTTMLHILAGEDPGPIALAPFTPAFTNHRELNCAGMGIKIHPDARMHLLPSLSSYVGADIVAGIASLDEIKMGNYIFVDIGTNGEIALVTPERIWCAATAAGPAFEGANISCGSGAFEGAISRFSSSGFSTIADAPPVSICGSGLVDIIAFLVETGNITADGLLRVPYVVSPRINNGIDTDIVITPQDVREVQLAKGAIAAGIEVLLKRSGFSPDRIDHLVIAGGFGNYLSIESAMRIGLLPAELKERTIQVGNAAGTGATLALKSEAFMRRINDVISRSEYIELSYDEDFPLEFAMHMQFPEP